MECAQIDLNNICRTCKGESPEMKSLYYRDSERGKENPRLDEMLMTFTSLQINNDDGLPKLICLPCHVLLKSAYAFKQQCEKADVSLREYLEDLKKATMTEDNLLADLEYLTKLLDDNSSELEQVDAAKDKNKSEKVNVDPKISTNGDVEKDMDSSQVFDDTIIYECKTCSKDFFTLEGLKIHERIHCDNIFSCKQCDKTYTTSQQLHTHKLSHLRIKAWVCKICNKTLTKLENLKSHLIRHLKKTLLNCLKCGRRFNCARHLEEHITLCKGETVYICDICNEAFNQQDSMEVHRKIHQHKFPALPTLENLDNINIVEYYMEMDYDEKTMFTNESEEVEEEDSDVTEATVEPVVGILENPDQAIAQLINEIHVQQDPSEMLLEKTKSEQQIHRACENANIEADNANDFDFHNSTHSECLPKKHASPKIKRGKRRRRKRQTDGRPRKRPPLKDRIKTKPKPNSLKSTLEWHTDQQHDNGLKFHECETCNKKFSRLISLKRHKSTHLKTKPFVSSQNCTKGLKLDEGINSEKTSRCKQCGKSYTKPHHLFKHELTHIKPKFYICKICNKPIIKLDRLKHHLKKHLKEKPFNCLKCGRGFIRASDFKTHVPRCKGHKVYICDICTEAFNRQDTMEVHREAHENKFPVLPTMDNLDNVLEYYTGIDYDQNSTFTEELEREEDLNVTEENVKSEVELLENQEQVKMDEIAQITNEIHMAEKPSDMLLEKAKSAEEINRDCEDMDIAADNVNDFDSQNNVAFEYVSVPMKQLSPVKRHLPQKRYRCETCEKAYISKSHLTRHMKCHFLCSQCGQMFIRYDQLVLHIMKHQGETLECKFCGKVFFRVSELLVHQRICNISKIEFVTPSKLEVHMRRHRGEKPYRCAYCDAAFTNNSTLKIHFRRHTGEKLQCNMCPRKYWTESALNHHKRQLHGLTFVGNRRQVKKVRKIIPDAVTVDALKMNNKIKTEDDSRIENAHTQGLTVTEDIRCAPGKYQC